MKRFNIFAEQLKTVEGGDGRRRLHGVASSTVKDRHGDVITLRAMKKMEQAAVGMTIFFNHSYNIPEDVAGTVEKAEIKQHPSDRDIYDLVYDIVMNEANPRAINSWDAQKAGSRFGLSIGARIPDGGATIDAKGIYTIDDIELLETSIVGVPASPRSWVEYAVKSLRTEIIENTTKFGSTDVSPEEDGVEEPDYDVEAVTDVVVASEDNPLVSIIEDEQQTFQEAHAEPTTPDTDTDPALAEVESAVTPQDAPNRESNPDTGDVLQSNEEPEITAAAALPLVADTLKQANQTIVALNRELDVAKSNKQAADEVRDQVVAVSQKAMADTASLLERLAETTKGRQTSPVVAETQTAFAGLSDVYGDDVMALLTKGAKL